METAGACAFTVTGWTYAHATRPPNSGDRAVSNEVPTPHLPAFTEGGNLLARDQGFRKGPWTCSYKMAVLARLAQGVVGELLYAMMLKCKIHATTYDKIGLIKELRSQFHLDFHGLHGIAHWARVKYHGTAIGRLCSADLQVVELFSFLHDSRRLDDDMDLEHGKRAAEYAHSLNGKYYELSADQLEILCEAITGHSSGGMHKNPTIQTCWDADRLDLGRVGIVPSAEYVSAHAYFYIGRAYKMSSR